MRRVCVSLVLAGLALGAVGCGAAASGVGRAAVGAGARTGARAATVTVPKVVAPTVPRVVTPAAKTGGQAGSGIGHVGTEIGQQVITGGLGDDRKKR